MAFSVEELITPIDFTNPSGRDLRYDPVFDTIQEARSEEDDTLPMGDWARQAKRADYPLVATLAREALTKRSKDLWLAVWLGEASLNIEEYEAIAPVLSLLLELQRRFWPTLYPGIDDDDLALRAAPLDWGLSRYAKVLQHFSVTQSGISYAKYRSTRLSSGAELPDGELTGEILDAEISATPKAFYVEIEKALTNGQALLEELYLFCEDHYRAEGPSFTALRSALEEVHNLVSQLLRSKQVQEPEPPPQWAAVVESPLIREVHTEAETHMQEPNSVAPPAAPETVSSSEEVIIDSWEKVLGQLSHCADFLIKDYPAHPTTYLLVLALQYGQESVQQVAPRSETRLTLKKTNEEGEWNKLLQCSLVALQERFSSAWLDLNRYVWQTADATANAVLRTLVSTQTRVLLENDLSAVEALFEDDTPVANAETRQWLANTILPAAPKVEHKEFPVLTLESPLPSTGQDAPEMDPYATARMLASRGELTAAIELLFANRTVRPGSRSDFMTRLQLCHLCMESGQGEIVLPVMRQMLATIKEKKLERWEEPEVLTELFTLHLKVLSITDDASEREDLYSRLCEIDPAAAIAFEMTR